MKIISKLEAILRGKLEEVKIENRKKRINQALEAAKTNAESKEIDAQLKIDEVLSKLSETTDVTLTIAQISDAINSKEEAQAELKRIDEIKAILNEEVEVED